MSIVSLQVNVPVQLGILDYSDVITVSNTLVQEVDERVEYFVSDYAAFVGGAIIPDVGTKMATFAETVISNEVSSSIQIKPSSTLTSVKIQVAENANTDAINEALQSALGNLPAIQPDTVQIVLTFVLATETIETDDYTYDGKMSWTLAINYNRLVPINNNFINSVTMFGK